MQALPASSARTAMAAAGMAATAAAPCARGSSTCTNNGLAAVPSFAPIRSRSKGCSRLHLLSVRASGESSAEAVTASSEPKWKAKLAAADKHAEETRQATFKAQEEYRRRQAQLRRQEGGAVDGGSNLADLEWIPYLTEDGKISDCSKEGAKATVYGVFDVDRTLQYVGISRQVYQSMRLHFARMPRQCVWVKVLHIARPSRSALEAIRDQWVAEQPVPVPGNDGGATQHRWENAVDCKPLMTEEERKSVELAAPGPAKAKALKEVARRVERELEDGFKSRNCTETLRFDPKLKESGLLDLKSTAYTPDTKVPTSTPEKKAEAKA